VLRGACVSGADARAGRQVGGGGGPALEALALEGDPKAVKFGVPMEKRKDCHFSFAVPPMTTTALGLGVCLTEIWITSQVGFI
jgi:hypothetical protein